MPVPPTIPGVTTVSERVWNAGQSWHYQWTVRCALVRLGATSCERTLRVRIQRNAYDDQSSAIVEAWSGTRWEGVVTAPITECECRSVSYVTKGVAAAAFHADAKRLLAEALEVIR